MYTEKKKLGFKGFLIGGAIGSLLTFLFTPRTGKQMRGEIQDSFNDYKNKAIDEGKRIVKDAKSLVDDIIKQGEDLRVLTKNYIEGLYTGPIDRIELEISNMKRAFTAAVEAYRQSPQRTQESDTIVNELYAEFEDETLPKYEGMGHRHS